MEKVKLICIPHAGAGANYYVKLKRLIKKNIEIYSIELPGRGRRITEPLLYDFSLALEDLLQQVIMLLQSKNDSYILFGHSLGSVFAFELAHKLIAQGYSSVHHLFLSGQAPVNHFNLENQYSTINEEFKNEILQLGGIDSEFLKHEELMKLVLSVIFADYKTLYSYKYHPHTTMLHCDITTFSGNSDPYIKSDIMDYWKDHTSGIHHKYVYDGGHFFIDSCIDDISDKINKVSSLIR